MVEKLLLPSGCHFQEDAKAVICCWDSKEILACPGSGKTTVLLAKLKLLADKLPLKDGRGVCVLSHTNVAVNELKGKMGDAAEKLLGYPNFVGTLQTFVDQFITFPFLKQYTNKSIQVVDRPSFAAALFSLACKRYKTLAGFVRNQQKSYSSVLSDVVSFTSSLYLNNGALYVWVNGTGKLLAGATSISAQNYIAAVYDLLTEEGLIRYEDAYSFTVQALEQYGESLRKLLSRRFQYVFVDEYQDCSEIQRHILDRIFANSESLMQKIGDVDQAIYSGTGDNTPDWQVTEDRLSIANTNRYGQEIADVLTLLRTGKNQIHSERGMRGIKPTLLIYDNASQNCVISSFVGEIQMNHLSHPTGVYKAIGMFKNVSGLKIGDYWSDFQAETSNKSGIQYSDFITQIIMELESGKLYQAERYVRKLLCRVYHYHGIKNPKGKEYSVNSVKQYIAEKHADIYQVSVLQLAKLQPCDYAVVDSHIRALLVGLLGTSVLERLPDNFMNSTHTVSVSNRKLNTYQDEESRIEIVFDTVYGVKGETHDATLYLETETKRSTDIKRILPLLEGKPIKGEIHEKSRKCVYVGFSRPRHLLCLAISKSTYKGHERAFLGWKIIDLTAMHM